MKTEPIIRTVIRLVKSTEGAFGFHEIMAMELADFNDVVKELNIMESEERFANIRNEDHAKAVR